MILSEFNSFKKKMEITQIAQDNHLMLRRIQMSQPKYKKESLEKDFKKNQRYVKNLCLHPISDPFIKKFTENLYLHRGGSKQSVRTENHSLSFNSGHINNNSPESVLPSLKGTEMNFNKKTQYNLSSNISNNNIESNFVSSENFYHNHTSSNSNKKWVSTNNAFQGMNNTGNCKSLQNINHFSTIIHDKHSPSKETDPKQANRNLSN